MVVRRLHLQAVGGETRTVGGQRVAAAGVVGGVDVGQLVDDQRGVLEVVLLEVVGEAGDGVGAALDADRGAVEILDGLTLATCAP